MSSSSASLPGRAFPVSVSSKRALTSSRLLEAVERVPFLGALRSWPGFLLEATRPEAITPLEVPPVGSLSQLEVFPRQVGMAGEGSSPVVLVATKVAGTVAVSALGTTLVQTAIPPSAAATPDVVAVLVVTAE